MARANPQPSWPTGALAVETICGQDPTPPAQQALLLAADLAVLEAALGPYVGCGHMVDANLSGQSQRQVGIPVAPGTRYGRMHVTRSGHVDLSTSAAQADTTVGGTTAGIPSTITAKSPYLGSERYLETGSPLALSVIVTTGTALVASPDPSRAVQFVEANNSAIEMVEVNVAAGFCVEIIDRTADIETL